MERDVTTGNIWKTVLEFSLPYLFAYFLQTLYGMADLFIIGQFCGVESTTAVSIGSQTMHMITCVIVGLAMGSTVIIGQAVGAKKKEQAAEAIGNTILLFMGVAVTAMLLLLLSVRQIVEILATPEEAVHGTILYLAICFVGIPFITAYNIIGSVFRGLGDSRTPMYFIAVACAANILLDYLFIGGMQLGAVGAALGTVLAQTLSVLISVLVIRKRDTGIPFSRACLKFQKGIMKRIFQIGIPIALQDGFIQIGFLIITIFANMRGIDDAAAVGIVEKMISLLFLVPSSMLQTVSALAAQNIGAGRYDRAKEILQKALIITVGWGILAMLVVEPIAPQLIRLFTDRNEVVVSGAQYLRPYVVDVMCAGIHFSFSGYFCACGRAELSFIHNMISNFGVRIPGTYLMSRLFPTTLLPMGIVTPTGSAVSGLICLAAYLWLNKKLKGSELK